MKFLRCNICGKMVVQLNDKPCPTKCCGEAMEELVPNTQDGAHEKHIPVVSVENGVVTVKVGEVAHPMLDAHYIEWIMIQTNFGNQRKVLKPGDEPVARFALLEGEKVERALEYCNLHGFYSTK
jgi:superoxide reductase